MKKNGSRRNFIRRSTIGLGGLILPATAATGKKINLLSIPVNPVKQLHIIVLVHTRFILNLAVAAQWQNLAIPAIK